MRQRTATEPMKVTGMRQVMTLRARSQMPPMRTARVLISPMQPGMGGLNGMGAFPPMQPGAQKPFPSVQAPFSMDAPNQPGVDGQSDADDYMKRLRSIK